MNQFTNNTKSDFHSKLALGCPLLCRLELIVSSTQGLYYDINPCPELLADPLSVLKAVVANDIVLEHVDLCSASETSNIFAVSGQI